MSNRISIAKAIAQPFHLIFIVINEKNSIFNRFKVNFNIGNDAKPLARCIACTQLVGHHLQSCQRTHPREQRKILNRFGQEIIGTRLKASNTVRLLIECRYHYNRNMGCFRIGLNQATSLKPIHTRHHHIKKDNVRLLGSSHRNRFLSRICAEYIKVFRPELCFEQLNIWF